MGYIVLHQRGTVGAYCYKFKTELEAKTLYGAFNCLEKEGFQSVYISNPEAYGEYAPYTMVNELSELFIIAGNMASTS
jgi:heptaprenylglyceryl phosphate synthase